MPPRQADKQEVSDADAEADEWDDAEYERRMKWRLTQVYSQKSRMELRDECRDRNLHVGGHKKTLVERVVNHDVQKAFAWGGEEAADGEGK
jgi:alpha-D-ribose 1-methylphosphonate 5-triphosphate diphosphatase PhnM